MFRPLPPLLALAACATAPPALEAPCATQLCRLERYLDAWERGATIPVQDAPECVAIGQVADCAPLYACPARVYGSSGNAFDRVDVLALVGTDVNALAEAAQAAEAEGSVDGELPEFPSGTVPIALRSAMSGMGGYAHLHGSEPSPPEVLRTCTIAGADGCTGTVGYVCEGSEIEERFGTNDPVAFEVQLDGEAQITALLQGEPTPLE